MDTINFYGIKWLGKYKQDVSMALFIIGLPFMIYLHLLFSDNTKEFIIFGLDHVHGFENNQTFAWYVLGSLIPLMGLLLIFFTTFEKWKYSLIPLMILFFNALMYNLNVFEDYNDVYSSVRGLIILLLFIDWIFLIDFYLFRSYRNNILKQDLREFLSNQFRSEFVELEEKFKSIINEKKIITPKKYLHKLLNAKLFLSKRIEEFIIKNYEKSNSTLKRSDWIIIIIICLNTSLWFTNKLVPIGTERIDLGWFHIDSNGFLDVNIYIWYLSNKFIMITPLLLWFFTCKHWWRYAILCPLTLYAFQFWEAYQNVNDLDSVGNSKVFPIILIMLFILYAISRLLKYVIRLMYYVDYIAMESEDILRSQINDSGALAAHKLKYYQIKQQIHNGYNLNSGLKELNELKMELIKSMEIKN
jgi:hypothetical protein